MSKFRDDYELSKKKNELMKDIWKVLSYDGRYIMADSKFQQKNMGCDIILQSENGKSILVDTKNSRGNYNKLLLEEMSCPARGVKGWLLKENTLTDFLFFSFWIDLNFKKAYYVPYRSLRDWFLLNYTKYRQIQEEKSLNHSTARLVHISDVVNNIKGIKHITREFGKVKVIDADSQIQKRIQATFDF